MSKPNVLWIIADHQAWMQHQRPGEYPLDLPVWREFCGEGVCFDQAYSIIPLCTPARACMMTGVYPHAHGLTVNTDAAHAQREFRPGQELYSHALARAGYRNAYVGKWHCGHERLPCDYGIEGWSLEGYGIVYTSDAYRQYTETRGLGPARARMDYNLNHPEWAGQTLTLHHPSPWHFMNGCGVLEGPPEAHENQFVAHLAGEKLRELAREQQPFSLVASFWGPHQPYYPSEPFASEIKPGAIPEYGSFRDDLAGRPMRHFIHRECHHTGAKAWRDWGIWQQVLARVYAQQRQLDAAIGSLLEVLRELKLAENTIVIWCADHGDGVASHGGLWDKASTMTEEVMRIPLAVRCPGAFGGGLRRGQLFYKLDLTARRLEAAGCDGGEKMHSRSLLPLCRDEKAPRAEELVCFHYGHVETAVQLMLRWKQYKYVAAIFDGHELYDLERDPYEMHNLINEAEYAELGREMRGRLLANLRQRGDNSAEGRQMAVALQYGGGSKSAGH